LKSERGMDSKLLELTAEAMTCSIACESEYADPLKNAASFISSLHTDLLATVLDLDKGSISQTESSEKAIQLKENAEIHLSAITELKVKTDDPLIEGVSKYLENVSDSFSVFDSELSGVDLSSAIKRAYVSASYAYCDLLAYDTND